MAKVEETQTEKPDFKPGPLAPPTPTKVLNTQEREDRLNTLLDFVTRQASQEEEQRKVFEFVNDVRENWLAVERQAFYDADEEEQAEHAEFLRDAPHADDNFLQSAVYAVESWWPVREYLTPALKIGGGGAVVGLGLRAAYKAVYDSPAAAVASVVKD